MFYIKQTSNIQKLVKRKGSSGGEEVVVLCGVLAQSKYEVKAIVILDYNGDKLFQYQQFYNGFQQDIF